ncbi:PAS domain-containing protein [Nordella sp. HKS 07]|uniref:sensor histidine kinase n=1 Tax=Nordella sp. HKS 07 TaxID=2712222 RepID=UPI0013E0F25B|nr:HWE histidine kinase domain-containing protein [Nordella sp. HKS 07]QIG49273.1 PAS domain-containing protein [Nordella sp. HKS 07]
MRQTAKSTKAGKKGRAAPAAAMPEDIAMAANLSGAMLYHQDSDLKYVWINNPPSGYLPAQFVGLTDEDIYSSETVNIIVPAKRKALESGETQTVEFQMPVDGKPRWFELRISAISKPRGRKGLLCAAIDIGERKQTEYHMRVLLLELAHRSKNLLAVIQGIANRTAQTSSTIDEFNQRFSGRLMSLSRAHDILTDENWRGAAMSELIRTQVLLFAGKAAERVHYKGDHVSLRPSAAQHVALALYELTANALKFGALSGETGEVEISWSLSRSAAAGATFQILWMEKAGPKVNPPNTRHFGRVLLEEVVPLSVQGKAKLSFTPEGISYSLTMPQSELI